MLNSDQWRDLNEFLVAIGEPKFPPVYSIWVRWWAWHCDHPAVAVQLYGLAMTAKRRGFTNYGLKAIWEVLRWHFVVEKTEEFKCANAYTSRYARFLMWKYPELNGFFRTTELRAA